MSTLSDAASDFRSFSDGLQESWPVIKAHVTCHVIIVFLLIGFLGTELPFAGSRMPNPDLILGSAWYKLAMQTGLSYLLLALPLYAASAYGSVLFFCGSRIVALITKCGGVLWIAFMRSFPKRATTSTWSLLVGNPYALLSADGIIDLALYIEDKAFTLDDLARAATQLVMQFEIKANPAWKPFKRIMYKKARSSQVYAYDFLVFMLAWCAIFLFCPRINLSERVADSFAPILVVLALLSAISLAKYFKDSRDLIGITILFTSLYIRWDPGLSASSRQLSARRRLATERITFLLAEESAKHALPRCLAPIALVLENAFMLMDILG